MASKRFQRGQPVERRGDERDFNRHVRLEQAPDSSKNSIQLYYGAYPGRDQPVLQWRAARIERFIKIQKCKREWINFCEIAEWCSDESGGVVSDEVAREAAYQKLQRDLLEGDFEENGRSRVLYLHPYSTKARMTRDWLRHVMEVYADQTAVNSQFLAHCWIPRELFERWLAKHRMQAGPPRFAPKWSRPPAIAAVTQASKAVSPPVAHGASEAGPQRRFGPEPGTLRRYAADDRALFPELERIMAEENMSRSAAALSLAEAGRIAGVGGAQSRAKRLAALHKCERPD